MSVSKDLQKIVILCVVVAGLILGSFYLYINPGGSDAEETTTNAETATATEEVAGENFESAPESAEREASTVEKITYPKSYTDKKYGFSIEYPDTLEWEGENPEEKLLFSLSGIDGETTYEFWVKDLEGKTLEQAFEEKLELEDETYFEWIEGWGGKVTTETLGANSWLFIDGTAKGYLSSHFMLHMPQHDAYLIVDIGHPTVEELELIRNILSTLEFIN